MLSVEWGSRSNSTFIIPHSGPRAAPHPCPSPRSSGTGFGRDSAGERGGRFGGRGARRAAVQSFAGIQGTVARNEANARLDALSSRRSEVSFAPMIGRNDPCPCGSGKKYKKCHLESDDQSDNGLARGNRPAGMSRWHDWGRRKMSPTWQSGWLRRRRILLRAVFL